MLLDFGMLERNVFSLTLIVSPRTGTGGESQDGGQYTLSERRER